MNWPFWPSSPLKISFLIAVKTGLYDNCLLELELPADFSFKSFASKLLLRTGAYAIRQLLAKVGVT